MSLIVADIGNSRIKWGRSSAGAIDAHVSLPSDDSEAWSRQWDAWQLTDAAWAVASVAPPTRDRFVQWLQSRSTNVRIVESFRDIPVEVAVERPDKVGLDRLLNAAAANARRGAEQNALIIDAGSAVTVDHIDRQGVFRGGAIFPGLRLMSSALHDYTAQLPLVDVRGRRPPPGTETSAAIETGVLHAVVGGIDRLLDDMRQGSDIVFFTGGDAALLAPHLKTPTTIWPEMTLEGIRLAAHP
jgi:type III pantothenate kinase